jgi:hypothetical protein
MTVLWFLALGGLGFVVLWIASVVRLRWWWSTGIVLALTAAVAVLLSAAQPTVLGRESWYNQSPYREAILFAVMLAGMAARVLSLAIEQSRSGSGTPGPVRVNKWDFVYPMLFAVPSFGALLGQLSGEQLTAANTILAFQTGFFWQTILKTVEARTKSAP